MLAENQVVAGNVFTTVGVTEESGERIAKEAYRERSLQELIDRRSVVVGGPRRCIETTAWYEAQGVDMMLFLVQAGTIRHEDVIDSLGRFGREVIPHFNGRRQRAAGE